MTYEQAMSRINNQMPDEEKIKQADYTILTDDINPLDNKVTNFLSEILQQ
jgi:dephospho-CoA kinase